MIDDTPVCAVCANSGPRLEQDDGCKAISNEMLRVWAQTRNADRRAVWVLAEARRRAAGRCDGCDWCLWRGWNNGPKSMTRFFGKGSGKRYGLGISIYPGPVEVVHHVNRCRLAVKADGYPVMDGGRLVYRPTLETLWERVFVCSARCFATVAVRNRRILWELKKWQRRQAKERLAARRSRWAASRRRKTEVGRLAAMSRLLVAASRALRTGDRGALTRCAGEFGRLTTSPS